MALDAVRPSIEELTSRLDSSMCVKCQENPQYVGPQGNKSRICIHCKGKLDTVRRNWIDHQYIVEWKCALCHVRDTKRTQTSVSMYCDECARLSAGFSVEKRSNRIGRDADIVSIRSVEPEVSHTDPVADIMTEMVMLIDRAKAIIDSGVECQLAITFRMKRSSVTMSTEEWK